MIAGSHCICIAGKYFPIRIVLALILSANQLYSSRSSPIVVTNICTVATNAFLLKRLISIRKRPSISRVGKRLDGTNKFLIQYFPWKKQYIFKEEKNRPIIYKKDSRDRSKPF